MYNELLKKLSKYANDKKLSLDEYTFLIEKTQQIQNKVHKIAEEKYKLRKKYEETIKTLDKQEIGCNHEVTTYNADPAGGSDSCTKCDICEKEIDKYCCGGYDG